jgi:hypothetical protein
MLCNRDLVMRDGSYISERRPTETHFHVGAFDQAAEFQPMRHIFPEERLPWLHLGDA